MMVWQICKQKIRKKSNKSLNKSKKKKENERDGNVEVCSNDWAKYDYDPLKCDHFLATQTRDEG